MPDREILLRATAANHRTWFRRCAAVAGGGVERCDGLDIIVEGRSGTIAFPRPRPRESLDEVMRRAHRLGLRTLGCWALDEDRLLGTLLLARGFEWGWQPHWMALDLAALREEEPEHAVIAARGGQPSDLPYASARPCPSAARHLAVHEHGETVGHVVVNPWRRSRGIYDMAWSLDSGGGGSGAP